MANRLTYKNHLSGPVDLVTTYEEKRAGFLALALEKNIRMTPFLYEARVLRQAALAARSPKDLLQINSIQYAFLKAAGISDKAEAYLTPEDKENAKLELIEKFLEPAGPGFVDELVYRFLLTQGDALGGIMRNVGGKWAKLKFLDLMRAALHNSGSDYEVLLRSNKGWQKNSTGSITSEEIKAIKWQLNSNGKSVRTLIFDYKVRIVDKNVDACLYDGATERITDEFYQDPGNFISLGELKGGIDPAGADEHWKTGNTALQRIRDAFQRANLNPATFFVGAAIENAMATEIWGQLQRGILTNAANLTKASHMEAICLWILNL